MWYFVATVAILIWVSSPIVVVAVSPYVLETSLGNPKPASGFFGSIVCGTCTLALRYEPTATTTLTAISVPFTKLNAGANANNIDVFRIVDRSNANEIIYTDNNFFITTWNYNNNLASNFPTNPETWQSITLNQNVTLLPNRLYHFEFKYRGDTGLYFQSSNATQFTWVDDANVQPRWWNGSSYSADKSIYALYGCVKREIDMFGCSAPELIFTSFTDGVKDTGQQNWPLLAFVGIPASFVIGRYVISLIKIAV